MPSPGLIILLVKCAEFENKLLSLVSGVKSELSLRAVRKSEE